MRISENRGLDFLCEHCEILWICSRRRWDVKLFSVEPWTVGILDITFIFVVDVAFIFVLFWSVWAFGTTHTAFIVLVRVVKVTVLTFPSAHVASFELESWKLQIRISRRSKKKRKIKISTKTREFAAICLLPFYDYNAASTILQAQIGSKNVIKPYQKTANTSPVKIKDAQSDKAYIFNHREDLSL